MKICKTAVTAQQQAAVGGEDMELINQLCRRPLQPQQVYTFTLCLCDSEVDRDFERFTPECLSQLAQLFIGKTGIFDHCWSAKEQKARIYKTELVTEPGLISADGKSLVWLKAWAYMLRNEENQPLIDEIEAGIKKEVSIGCSVASTVCSVCGEDMHAGNCGHIKGAEYDGRLCYGNLTDATDAYEWSFVAVPAQRQAGVIKTFVKEDEDMQLEKEAALGRRYMERLRRETVRLAMLTQPELEGTVMEAVVKKLDEPELVSLIAGFEKALEKSAVTGMQLPCSKPELRPDTDYLI